MGAKPWQRPDDYVPLVPFGTGEELRQMRVEWDEWLRSNESEEAHAEYQARKKRDGLATG